MILAGVDWSNVTVAAAFVLGAVTGTVATIALTRFLFAYITRMSGPRGGDDRRF